MTEAIVDQFQASLANLRSTYHRLFPRLRCLVCGKMPAAIARNNILSLLSRVVGSRFEAGMNQSCQMRHYYQYKSRQPYVGVNGLELYRTMAYHVSSLGPK